jgi:serine phosphatase RsbU (regulator of sigma subunit)
MYDGETLYNYNEENGLKSNLIQGLSTDANGNPVIISNEGVDKIITKNNLFEYHGESEGLAYLEPNLNSLYRDPSGTNWIGTANGVLVLNSVVNDSIEVFPKIFITQKSIFLNPIINDQDNFKYNKNYFTFHYTALWYKSSESLTYRYMLEGYDLDWNTPTSLREVTYSSLPPGDFRFIVQVNYSGGNWMSSPDSEFSFHIRKPFWKTIWFILIIVIVIIIGIYAYIETRIRNLKHAKEILEGEVKKRTAEIQLQKEEIITQRDELEIQRNSVTEQRDKIELQNKYITSSIEYAGRIQRAVIPSEENFGLYLGEHFILFKPKEIVSGDFYYLNTKGDNIIVAAADCTGHGVPGAFMSILGISLLNQIINQEKVFFNAGDILNQLRTEIIIALQQTGKNSEAKDGMDISLCILNRKDQIIHFAGAYNPLLLVRNHELIDYRADKMPIGIFHNEEEVPFSNHTIKIEKGDIVYIFSDGYQDQFGREGKKRKKFLSKNFNNLLLEISNEPLQKQKEILEHTFNSWKGTEPQVDDIVVIGFKI